MVRRLDRRPAIRSGAETVVLDGQSSELQAEERRKGPRSEVA